MTVLKIPHRASNQAITHDPKYHWRIRVTEDKRVENVSRCNLNETQKVFQTK